MALHIVTAMSRDTFIMNSSNLLASLLLQ